MKHSPQSTKAATAFTLIELLVVIAIIAILVGLLFPAFAAVRESTRKVVAKNDATQIISAVRSYYTEYGKYPVNSTVTTDVYFGSSTAPSGTTGFTSDQLFDVLTNNTASTVNGTNGSKLVDTLNPRQIVFLNVPAVKNSAAPVSGIVPNTGTTNKGVWFDPWGSPYNVIIDSNYDNVINNPYASSDTNPPGGPTLSTSVIVWALGKNGALGGGAAASAKFNSEPGSAGKFTGSGDVISWQ